MAAATDIVVPAMKIRELAGAARVVILCSRALPYRPFSLKRKQRVEVKYNPGNPNGYATVLGPEFGPTDLKGAWKDIFIGDPSYGTWPMTVNNLPVTNVVDAETLFDQIMAGGSQLELSWAHVIRHGFLRDFGRDWLTIHDMEWSMSFEWTDDGTASDEPGFTGRPLSQMAADAHNNANALLAALQSAVNFASNLMATATQYQQMLGSYADQLDAASSSLVTAINAPINLVQNVASILTSTISTATDMMDEIQAVPSSLAGVGASYAALSGTGMTTDQQFQAVGSAQAEYIATAQLSAAADQFTVYQLARACRDQAVLDLQNYAASTTTALIATYAAKGGEDMRDVASRYYGSDLYWMALMLYNGLSSGGLFAGQIVRVPPSDDPVFQNYL